MYIWNTTTYQKRGIVITMLKAFIVDCIGNPKLYHCTILDNDKVILKMTNETHTYRQICDTIDSMDISKSNIDYRKEVL